MFSFKLINYRPIILSLSVLIILHLLSGISYAGNEFIIYTFSYGELLESIIDAVKNFMMSGIFLYFLRISLILAVVIIGLNSFIKQADTSLSFFIKLGAVGIFSLFLTTSINNVKIIDVENGNNSNNVSIVKTIDHVPAFIAYPMYIISNVEYNLKKQFSESLFNSLAKKNVNVGSSSDILNMNLVSSLNLLKDSVSFRINDESYIKTFESYFENCILPDIYSGYTNLDTLLDSETFWKDLKNSSHKARFGYNYLDQDKIYNSKVQTCDKLYDSLDFRLKDLAIIDSSSFKEISKSFGAQSANIAAKKLGIVSKVFLNYQESSSNFLLTHMNMNLFNDSYKKIATSIGISDTGLSYGIAKSNSALINNSVMQAINAKKYLLIAKSYLTIIFVAVIPIIALLGIATGNISKSISMILGLLLALSLWGILEQIFDFILMNRSLDLFSSISGSLSIRNSSFINQNVLDSLSIGMGFYFLIPTFAFALAAISGYAASNIMGGVSSIGNTGIGAASEEISSGNANIGNIRKFNYNTNKYDSAKNIDTGFRVSDNLTYNDAATSSRIVTSNLETGSSVNNYNDNINRIRNISENIQKSHYGNETSKVISGDNLEINGKNASGIVSFNGSVASFSGVIEGSNGKTTKTISNASISYSDDGKTQIKGEEVYGREESGLSKIEDNSVTKNSSQNLMVGENFSGIRQSTMKESALFKDLMEGVVDMQEAVKNGSVSSSEYLAHVRNLSGAIAQESMIFGEMSKVKGTNNMATLGAKGEINLGYDSSGNILGFVAKSLTGGNLSGSVGAYGNYHKDFSLAESTKQNILANDLANIMLSENNAEIMTSKISNKLSSFAGSFNSSDIYPNGVLDNNSPGSLKYKDVNMENIRTYLKKIQ